MTTLLIPGTLMNNYASLTLIRDNFYDELYLDNQFSSKTDASNTVATNYLTTNYINTVGLTSVYYNKTETSKMLLSYSTGSYADYNLYTKTDTGNLLANKVSTTGDATISGTLNAQRLSISNTTSRPIEINNTMHNGTYLVAISKNSSNNDLFFALRCLPLNQLWCFGVATSNQYIISHGNSTKLSIQSNGNTTISGKMHVQNNDSFETQSILENTGGTYCSLYWKGSGVQGRIYVGGGSMEIRTDSNHRMQFKTGGSAQPTTMTIDTNRNLTVHRTFYNNSDDRLEENEELITHACETLSKLRQQLYDKKPDIENHDSTTWDKESGLIAQEIYYDAPELRHLVYRSPELDEEGNSIPLPEIPTSIDPQQDPDYPSWGKDPASINYIGLTAYLIKASTELHERVKALEAKYKSKKKIFLLLIYFLII